MKRIVMCSVTALGLWASSSMQSLIADGVPATSGHQEIYTGRLVVDDLSQHWVRSSEEERPGESVQVFRPAGSKEFPPSRFRMAYKFARDRSCEWLFLSPDDAHRFKPCTWRVDARDNTLLQITADGATGSYRIVELSKKLLRITPVEPSAGK